MGIGPAVAIPKVLKQAGLGEFACSANDVAERYSDKDDIDFYEINEVLSLFTVFLQRLISLSGIRFTGITILRYQYPLLHLARPLCPSIPLVFLMKKST